MTEGFADVALRRHYNSDEHDLLAEFYCPLIRAAKSYKRAVGYFSSSAFRACAAELGEFIGNSGSIQIVIGCLVSPADVAALTDLESSDREPAVVRAQVLRQLEELRHSDFDSALLLSRLVIANVVQLKFAVRDRGIYHEKFGIFIDLNGNKVAFIGSANETEAALSVGANHESFSAYMSSEPIVYSAYGEELERRFEALWNGRTKETRIYDLDHESIALMRQIASAAHVHQRTDNAPLPPLAGRYELRPYQNAAIKAWADNKYHGILAMATGTGKTLTAIDAVKRFKSRVIGGAVVVTVPYQNLAIQWMNALREQGLDVLPVFQSYAAWYSQAKNIFLGAQISLDVPMPCLVCVNDSFKDDRFQELLELLANARQPHHFIIVDECHHFNAPEHIRRLPEHFSFRLGLSATPYDQFALHYLDSYFDQIVYEFPIGRAIREGFLSRYRYHILPVRLDEEETEDYDQLTLKIVQIAGSDDGFTPETLAKAQPLLLRRTRVVGAAKDKVVRLRDHLRKKGRTPFTLFYCGDGSMDEEGANVRQIEMVSRLLDDLGWRTSRITAEESLKLRESLLDGLRRRVIDAVVSIKVLDEGIDVPVCQSAYLLASQSSDRQGIQRRGRVLRKAEGKDIADLYDFIVVGGAGESKAMRSLAAKELRRAYQFAGDADNAMELGVEIDAMAKRLGVTVGESNGRR
jgi:superfamily II DNA or RNA helicase